MTLRMLLPQHLIRKAVINMSEFSRRLPVYLLLDVSGSMQGDPIEAVRHGVRALISELRGDPQALETAYLSVITFNSSARQVTPLTELMLFKEPQLSAGGATALGAALRLLADCIKSEVRKSTETQKGDWRPLVFILTDGAPTDDRCRTQDNKACKYHCLRRRCICRYNCAQGDNRMRADDEHSFRRRPGSVLCMGIKLCQDVLQEP